MSINLKAFVRSFDLFSKPFVFLVGDKNSKNKTTFIGGLLSLSVLSVSIIYFYYLLNMYFGNKIEPKTTTRMSIESSYSELKITENFFIFEMIINGEPLSQYQKRVGKIFLTYAVNYEVFYQNGTYFNDLLPLVGCADPNFQGFFCIEDKDIQNKNILIEPILLASTDFSLEIYQCNSTLISNCATDEEIKSTIFTGLNYFQVFTKIRQYNPQSRNYEDGYKTEYFYFDHYNLVFSRISLIKATTTVKEGLIVQTSKSSDDIYDYKRIDTVLSKADNEEDRFTSKDAVGYVIFEINQVRNIIMIQHAMITEVLAQFMSIFNSLLIIGIIAQMLAQTHIVEDMNNLLLKEYYKKSALMLGSNQGGKELLKKDSMPHQLPDNKQDAEILSHEIALLQKKIKRTNFTGGERKYFHFGFKHSVKLFFYKLLGKRLNIDRTNDNQSNQIQNDQLIYQQLLNQSVKGINIYEVYKDIIKLKMAIKIMLTKEQYAAIQFCGSEILSSGNYKQCFISEKPVGFGISEEPVGHQSQISAGKDPIKKISDDTTFKASPNDVSPVTIVISTTGLLKSKRKLANNSKNRNNNDNKTPNELISSGEQLNYVKSDNHLGQASSQTSREEKIQKMSNQSQDELTEKKELEEDKQGRIMIQVNDEHKKLETAEPHKETKEGQKSLVYPQNMVKLQTSLSYLPKNNGDNNPLNDIKLVTLTDEDEEENQRDEDMISTIRKELQKNTNNNQQKLNIQGEIVMHARDRKEISNLLLQNSRVSHLSKMDLIDEDPGLQEDLLKQFLLRIGQANPKEIISHVDRQIFESLIRSTEGIENNNNNSRAQSTKKNEKDNEQLGECDQGYQPEICFSSVGMLENRIGQQFSSMLSQNNNISPRQQLEEKNETTSPQWQCKEEAD